MSRHYTIALVGNPNSGKSSLFNALTGLNQKVGNFPGVTVDKKTGIARIIDDLPVNIIDLPGTYSLYPKSADEQVTYEVLLNQASHDRPDMVVVIADASNLKRNLLFCSQIMDLKLPVVIALTMLDIAKARGCVIDVAGLEQELGVPVVAINPRKNKGIAGLKKAIAQRMNEQATPLPDFIDINALTNGHFLHEIAGFCSLTSDYAAMHVACNYTELRHINAAQRIRIAALLGENTFFKSKIQANEILERYRKIDQILSRYATQESPSAKLLASERIDKILLHPLWGNVILLTVLFLLFQSIFWLAKYPMDWIQQFFAFAGDTVGHNMPDGMWKDLVVNGLLAGISGIMVFVPQIMILFGLITILEDSGYMARISFLTDRIMRSAGLNGRSVMPLISGMACAVPAIMATRTIQNRKERLITILVTPLMSCSARLPVYTMLIALVVPDRQLGFFNLQGLVLMGLYFAGFLMALIVSKVLGWVLKAKERSYFLMELPVYRAPRW
ncbi:MAG: ferrous iron transport protein B, partial [Chitinophagia bacterium]|nr:ferrous iron transport protein B [Chitinophagia bacterium]